MPTANLELLVDIHCEECDTLYHLSPTRAGQRFRCHLCRTEQTVKPPRNAEQADPLREIDHPLYVVCSYCRNNFTVPMHAAEGKTSCPTCGKDVDLSPADGDAANAEINPMAETLILAQKSDPGNVYRHIERAEDPRAEEENVLTGYRIGQPIGHTALGTIYEGTQIALRRMVAIYLLSRALAADEKRLEVFLEQARKAAGLVHPHIARVYDVGSEGEQHYMVSELVKGESLEQRVRERNFLDFREVARIGQQIAKAVQAAHEREFIHSGLCPANVIIDRRGEARVLHFGIGRSLTEGDTPRMRPGATGLVLFLPPEQLLGKEYTVRSDIFSLGVTLYTAMTGTLPYSAVEMEYVMKRRGTPRPPDIERLCPDIPPALAHILLRLLQMQPAERPATAKEVAVQFEAFLQNKFVSAAAPGEEKTPAQGLPADLPRVDKRKYKRFRAEMDVRCSKVELDPQKRQDYLAKVRDLSENGAFVQSDNPLPPGSFVEMEFALEGGGAHVRVLGLVRWRDDTPGEVGMGVQFLEVSTQNRGNLSRFIDERAANDTVRSLMSTHLHRTIMRFLYRHWGEEVPAKRLMAGTGAGRALFERALAEFEEAGLVRVRGDRVQCISPESEVMRRVIDQALHSTRL
jgi:serine/threonine protein kinase/ribosomal protein S27E